jgi:UPF0755 protein
MADSGISAEAEFRQAARSQELLAELGIPAKSVEGYLFPDTYFFPPEFPPTLVIEAMVENFMSKVRQVAPDVDTWDRRELHDHVILASIVEREYRVAEEAPLIASVFKNRLQYNIGLESCATIAFIITEEQGKPHPLFITREDLGIDSEYNTYKWAGLPPGPISNPGLVALAATFDTPETDFYYFLLKDEARGTHYFSGDLDQHNLAKSFYLKGVAGP